jgi:uncharacterized protein (TIGR03435 family)
MLANHLWQSTICALLAAALGLTLRRNRAGVRYWLWMAASLKFLVPFDLLTALARQTPAQAAPVLPSPALVIAVEGAAQPFTTGAIAVPATQSSLWMPALLLLWALGFVAVIGCWIRRWRGARSTPTLEPGVFGILQPSLFLPAGIEDRLTADQMRAILAHEMCQIRRRDNLFAAIHMGVQAIFWFHPLVWFIGARLIEERERACDEEVLRQGNDPEAYAAGILEVCKLYLESRLPCIAGVTGSDLRRRVEEIMTRRISMRLTAGRKALLAAAAALVVAIPLLIGTSHAQGDAPRFDVASVKPAPPGTFGVRMQFTPGGGARIQNATLQNIIMMAFNIERFQLSGGPAWISSEQFEIEAKGPAENDGEQGSLTAEDRALAQRRLQTLLADRFGLVVRRDSKDAPVYALTVAKNGHKMKESSQGFDGINGAPGQLKAEKADMALLSRILSMSVGRPVIDRTALKETFTFDLKWSPESGGGGLEKSGPAGIKADSVAASLPEAGGASIFTAIQEQLGLRLEASKAPVESIVIERIERPSAN